MVKPNHFEPEPDEADKSCPEPRKKCMRGESWATQEAQRIHASENIKLEMVDPEQVLVNARNNKVHAKLRARDAWRIHGHGAGGLAEPVGICGFRPGLDPSPLWIHYGPG